MVPKREDDHQKIKATLTGTNIETPSEPGFTERPITILEQDALDRGRFVQRLCRALINPITNHSTGVVVGLTGPWGSGKTSILNLLHEEIKRLHKNSIVVRFNPWLVSGHDELVSQFFAEFIGTLNMSDHLPEKARKLAKEIASYGAHIAPLGNLIAPWVGSFVSGGLKAAEKALQRDKSLFAQRQRVRKELVTMDVPIVVFIDELDRVEDKEVRSVAQLVRSIMDFSNVSYLLAYDVDRVIEALGEDNLERGRAYLEKIVQFQIPLPIIFDDELRVLMETEIGALVDSLRLPSNWKENKSFDELMKVIIPKIIQTPRDVKRTVGTFHVLAGMVGDEVIWTDVLGVATLEVKAPQAIRRIQNKPDWVVENPLDSIESMVVRYSEKISKAQKLERILGPKTDKGRNSEDYDAISELLVYLFPFLGDNRAESDRHPDSVCYRRSLLTVLRLSLIPRTVPRNQIIKFLNGDIDEMVEYLRKILEADMFASFFDRLSDIYFEFSNINHMQLWMGISKFLRKRDREWLRQYSPMGDISRHFRNLFEIALARKKDFRSLAPSIFYKMEIDGDVTLTADLLFSLIWDHGLFGCDKQESEAPLFDRPEAEMKIKEASAKYRELHLSGKWLTETWNLHPVYIMLRTGDWDDECRKHLTELIKNDAGLDGVTLMLFGGNLVTEGNTLKKLFIYDEFTERLRKRFADTSDDGPHPTVRAAIEKALGLTA